jgi:type II secretory pathway pseudopilin PulG
MRRIPARRAGARAPRDLGLVWNDVARLSLQPRRPKSMPMDKSIGLRQQSGAVLVVSLILLLLLGLLATSVSENSLLQVQMSGNDEAKLAAQHEALAIVDAIIENSESAPVLGDLGYTVCSTDEAQQPSACDESTIDLSSLGVIPSDANVTFYVQRVGPEEVPLPFVDATRAGSASRFKLARHEIVVDIDRTHQGRGRVQLVQGLIRVLPESGGVIVSEE